MGDHSEKYPLEDIRRFNLYFISYEFSSPISEEAWEIGDEPITYFEIIPGRTEQEALSNLAGKEHLKIKETKIFIIGSVVW